MTAHEYRNAKRVLAVWFGILAAIVALCVWGPAARGDGATAWEAWCAKVDRTRLATWERQWVGRKPLATVTVWRTFYGPWDAGRYNGAPWHIACNRLPLGTVVWLEKDKRLCVVTNRGAPSNDSAARGHKAQYWTDLWSATRRGDNATQRLYVLGRAPLRH